MDNIIAQLEQVVRLTGDFLAEPPTLLNNNDVHVLELMSQWNTILSKLLEMIEAQTEEERKLSFHELCRPLNGILGCFELLLHQKLVEESLIPEIQQYIDKVAAVHESVKQTVKEMGVNSYWCGD
jgi:hypothetical protein